MSTVIHTRAMPEALRTLARKTGSTGRETAGTGFLDLAAQEAANQEGMGQTGFEASQLGLAEYRNYLSARISTIPIDPSRMMESFAVRISDDGLAAMQSDPAYEEWVLRRLAADWSAPKAAGTGCVYTTYSIGAEAESFQASSVDLSEGLEELDALGSGKETFWERRSRRHQEYMELVQREQFLRRLRNGSVSTAEYLLSGLG